MPRIQTAPRGLGRRRFLKGTAALAGLAGAGLVLPGAFPRPAIAQGSRPWFSHGLQSGDVGLDSAVVWARADRPSRLLIEWSTSESFAAATQVVGPALMEDSDLTGKQLLTGLPAGQTIFWRGTLVDLADSNAVSEPLTGRFRTGAAEKRDVSFVWSGDCAGQGWGINLDWGGMRIFETMRQTQPDFFIHSGDSIYADGPILPAVALPDGTIWKNVFVPEKAKVAETLAEFRAAYKYNLMDANYLAFNAEVPVIAQWDDHETTNNWYPNELLASDDRYKVKNMPLLSARSNKAFLEYMPIAEADAERSRIYRKISYGPLLDVFVIDMRSYRGDNTANREETETPFLGKAQMQWLLEGLKSSKATWKAIAADMPIGLLVPDGKEAFEAIANGDGPALGREKEIAGLLKAMKDQAIRNVVWFTADVHYTAAHYYDPNKAQFQDFNPFWEFVSGPLNAGTFGPNKLDNTFGPQLMYVKAPPEGQANLAPSAGMQFFGHVAIAAASGVMTVTLKDLDNNDLYQVALNPEA